MCVWYEYVFFFFLNYEKNAILFKEREKERKKNKGERQSDGPVGEKKEKRSLVLSMGPMIFNLFTKRPLSNAT